MRRVERKFRSEWIFTRRRNCALQGRTPRTSFDASQSSRRLDLEVRKRIHYVDEFENSAASGGHARPKLGPWMMRLFAGIARVRAMLFNRD